jgi:hypothetical protein
LATSTSATQTTEAGTSKLLPRSMRGFWPRCETKTWNLSEPLRETKTLNRNEPVKRTKTSSKSEPKKRTKTHLGSEPSG